MRKLILLWVFLISASAADAQLLSFFKSLAKKTGSLFSDEKEYKETKVAVAPYLASTLPAKVDFESRMPPVGSQNPQQSCVAWAVGYGCRSYYVAKQADAKFVTSKNTVDYSAVVSPAFIYNLINEGKNKGTSLSRALRLLKDTGACLYENMPYQKYNWRRQPDDELLKEALNYRIDNFWRIDMAFAEKNLKAQLASGTPVIVETVFDKYYYNHGYGNKAPFYIWDKLTTAETGMGHAILLMGYNDSLQAFKFMNSWGDEWGANGFGWITYKLVPLVIRQAYVIKPKAPPSNYSGKIIKKVRLAIADEDDETQRSEKVNTATILQRTKVSISENEMSKTDAGVFGQALSLKIGKPTADFSEGETEISMQGLVNVPVGTCDTFRVLVMFYRSHYGSKGAPVFGLNDEYKLANSFAAATSKVFYVAQNTEVSGEWSATIPVSALDIPYGVQTKNGYITYDVGLVAEPVLFADGVAISVGKPIEFDLRH